MFDILLSVNLEYIFKMILSVLVGSVIGYERKRANKPGGKRTFSLVALGSTLIAILSLELLKMQGLNPEIIRYDIARLMSYGLSGIGFIGAGVIWQYKNRVEGLTTASTLWAIVPTGFFIGLGMYQLAFFASLMIYLILESKYQTRKFLGRN